MAARCEAARRPNNEDNYQLDCDLSDNEWGFTADAQIELGKNGALLVVCDGMGGMNAGEVASDIAVTTIKEWFCAEKLTNEVLSAPVEYIKNAIKAADAAIKAHGKSHPETEGMCSTIVMAWMLGKKVYVGWCGDSRCYCYNSKTGLVRLSHDHSYVQELVDAGKLTEELAFDHPNNNIITRSLGDPNGVARPDAKEYDLHTDDVLMLCSDGLCGCLRDREMEQIIASHLESMQECRDALWVADEAAGWHDNVTIALAQIISGGKTAKPITPATEQTDSIIKTNRRLKLAVVLLVLVVVCIAGAFSDKPIVQYLKKHVVNPNDSTFSSEFKDDAIKAGDSSTVIEGAHVETTEKSVVPAEETNGADSEKVDQKGIGKSTGGAGQQNPDAQRDSNLLGAQQNASSVAHDTLTVQLQEAPAAVTEKNDTNVRTVGNSLVPKRQTNGNITIANLEGVTGSTNANGLDNPQK